MKYEFLSLICFLLLFNYGNSQTVKQGFNDLNTLIDSLKVDGSVLIYDTQNDTYYSNDFSWINNEYLPASTFKIPNSIIALELGIVENENSVLKWDGKSRWRKEWEKDLTFKDAFQASCVPCYQEIALKIGEEKMQEYLKKINYSGMSFDSSSLNNFWLEGNSQISQKQQIEFLKNLYFSKLPVSERTQTIVKKMLLIEKSEDHKFSGKTGWAVKDDMNIGWYVGYVEKDKNVYFFATNITANRNITTEEFLAARMNLTTEALKIVNSLN